MKNEQLLKKLGKPKGKKGAEMTIGTLVIIVLAVLVLVVLIVGFTGGWSSLWDKITNYFGGGPNVDTIKQACASACLTKSMYEFCSITRTLRYAGTDGKTVKTEASCSSLVNNKDLKGGVIQGVEVDSCVDIKCELENCEGKKFIVKNTEGADTPVDAVICINGVAESGKDKCKLINSAGSEFKDLADKPGAVCCKGPCNQ